jgi:predicted ATP-dependent serine protease
MWKIRCPDCQAFDTLVEITRRETIKKLCTTESERSLYVRPRAVSTSIHIQTVCQSCGGSIEGRPVASRVTVDVPRE